MIPVPGGIVLVASSGGPVHVTVTPFWIGKTEVTWDEYDVFAYRLDEPAEERTGADATARPSRPYGAPDYGWGHHGFPAISIAAPAAADFAAWLSTRTGRKYRLASDAEWTRAAEAGFGVGGITPTELDAVAWHAANAGARTHPVASRQADALGLHDMLGNAAEWVLGPDGRPLTRGGSWADSAHRVGPQTRARPTPAWNARDPQFPKSRWWLSDGPFVGFRLVRER